MRTINSSTYVDSSITNVSFVKVIMICIWKSVMKLIYLLFKIFPTKQKITCISRQTDDYNIDFEYLKKEATDYKVIILNKKLGVSFGAKIKYQFHMFVQMYHIATSKVLVLDSYCILASILKHKSTLNIIQLWHGMGGFKKFGYSILDKKEGRDKTTALLMNMHRNYNYVITTSDENKKHFSEAFDININNVITIGLPRIDFLNSKDEKTRIIKTFYDTYKELNNGKKNILYVPTYRKGNFAKIDPLIKNLDYTKYNLIISLHDGKRLMYADKKEIVQKDNMIGIELLFISDFVITDYSAICYEAAILNKPIYFYNYDYTRYNNNRGFYLNYYKDLPGYISSNITDILNEIEKSTDYTKENKEFVTKYVTNYNKPVTTKIIEFIRSKE